MHTTITKEFRFEAAHRLPLHAGACANLHGHGYKVEVTVVGPRQDAGGSAGMVADFSTLSDIVTGIIDRGQHCGRATVPWDHALFLGSADQLLPILQGLSSEEKCIARYESWCTARLKTQEDITRLWAQRGVAWDD